MKSILGLLTNKGLSPWRIGLLGMALLFANVSPAWAQNGTDSTPPAVADSTEVETTSEEEFMSY